MSDNKTPESEESPLESTWAAVVSERSDSTEVEEVTENEPASQGDSSKEDAPSDGALEPEVAVREIAVIGTADGDEGAAPESIDFTEIITAAAPEKSQKPKKRARKERKEKDGKKKAWAGKRLVALVAAVAVVSLAAGIALMQFIVSPAELAARTEAPEPGPVTALVQEQVIENTVVTRGEVTYADSVDVDIDTGSAEGRPIVTGQVPEVGTIFNPGSVALAVTGRPVIVLQGELPSYRTLSIGMSGPDVLQLKQALSAMGYYPGDVNSDYFQWDTATAVGQLYQNVGYQPPTGGPEAQEALRMAQDAVRQAEAAVERANIEWNEAAAVEGGNTAIASANITEAKAQRSAAYDALEEAQIGVQPTLPSGEVLFLPSLPRRVDAVYVKRGDQVSNPAMMVSGADLTIVGTVSAQDAALLEAGMPAYYTGPDGEELTATVVSVEAPSSAPSNNEDDEGGSGGGSGTSGTAGRYRLTLNPGELTEDQISALRGTNVKVDIPVASTDGEVLAVPIAALSASSDGGSVVELLVPTDADPFATERIPVETGLAAGGFVEVSSDDSRIASGAKVVVGR